MDVSTVLLLLFQHMIPLLYNICIVTVVDTQLLHPESGTVFCEKLETVKLLKAVKRTLELSCSAGAQTVQPLMYVRLLSAGAV